MNDALRRALLRLLRPLIRVLLKHGVSHGEFNELVRRVYVEVAEADFALAGRKQTTARIAMLTGIQRKEVSRLRASGSEADDSLDRAYNRGVRVIAGWRRDADFCIDEQPRALAFEGAHSFVELVRRYSGDLPARAVLDELLRTGVVVRSSTGMIELASESGFVPDDRAAQLQIMGGAVADLLGTLDHNFEADTPSRRLQLTTAYNNLPAHAVERFRHVSHEECVALLRRFDAWLAEHDRDSAAEPAPPEAGRYRAGIGIYYIEEEIPS